MQRYLFPLLLGVVGVAILASLGLWQLERLEWKQAILSDIEARISAEPVALPLSPDPMQDRYRSVMAEGRFLDDEIHVLVSQKGIGAGYRVVQAFETGGRHVLVDRGIIATTQKSESAATGAASVTGNLHWPDETDLFTPDPDTDANIWFARDVPAMAAALGTDETLIVAREIRGAARGEPLPVGTEGIPNNHLGYAIQWFGLAAVWAGMTAFLLWRMHGRTDEREA